MSSPDWTFWLSIVGAAAWIPPLISGIVKIATKPRIILSPSGHCLIGFTELGPIFNMNFAFTAEHSNILIDGCEVDLTHESGATYTFRWHEVVEIKGSLFVNGAPQQNITQESEAIALKILTTDFKDISLKFRLESHTEKLSDFDYNFQKERRRLFNSNIYDPHEFYNSNTVQDLQDLMQSQMIWRAGSYKANIKIKTKTNSKVESSDLHFSLSEQDMIQMKTNSDNIPKFLENFCLSHTTNPDEQKYHPLVWNWLNKKIYKS